MNPVTEAYPAPLDDTALRATWNWAWASLGRPAPAALQAELLSAWSEPHRYYHDQRHLRECLALWTGWRGHSSQAGEVAIALWFHDAIYDPQAAAGANELGSAAWAARSLVRARAGSEAAQRVHDLVMATAHATPHDAPAVADPNPDTRLLLDIDLSILGSPAERFERYDQDVRREYAWMPRARYQESRARVLQGFLNRPRLYYGGHAVALLERQARINLTAALSRLAQ